ncbi:MAG TPA: hypothetical protein VJH90_00435 [archaeon]|nr:hypothetical protein [archaeon]
MPPTAEITFYRGFDMPVTRLEETPDPVEEIARNFLKYLKGRGIDYTVEERDLKEGRLVIKGESLKELDVEGAMNSAKRIYANFWGKNVGTQIEFKKD